LLLRLLHLSKIDKEKDRNVGIHEVDFFPLAVDVLIPNADVDLSVTVGAQVVDTLAPLYR
jgi:hypothetical protein